MQLMLPIPQPSEGLDQTHQILVRIMTPEDEQLMAALQTQWPQPTWVEAQAQHRHPPQWHPEAAVDLTGRGF